MLSVSYAGKNSYSAGKTGGVLRGGASGANRGYVLAHCAFGPLKNLKISEFLELTPHDLIKHNVFFVESVSTIKIRMLAKN